MTPQEALAQTQAGKDYWLKTEFDWEREAILDIEQEAAQQERERLRNVWDGWLEFGMPPDVQRAIDSGDTPHVVWRLLTADPEDDR